MVIAIIGIGLTVFLLNFGQARNQALLEDGQASIINALEIARSRAASGVGDTKHGIRINPDSIITFEGDTYSGGGETIELPPNLSTDKNAFDIIFDRISAKPSNVPTTIEITHSSGLIDPINIEVNEVGIISIP